MQAWVRKEGADCIADAMFKGAGCMPCEMTGRGAMQQFSWTQERSGMLRKCRRGGLTSHILKDRYLLRNRPLQEFAIHKAILERGIPAPGLLGVCWQRRGVWHLGALATEWMDGMDLDAWLRDNTEMEVRNPMLRACGRLIFSMHEAGIYHADLQLKNIFVSEGTPLLLDFDRACVNKPVTHCARWRNLLRLRRSVEKRGHPDAVTRELWAGYGVDTPPPCLNMTYRIRERISDRMTARRTMQA